MLDESTLQRIHETLLEILKVIDRFCFEHDITYFLEGGSALGAARHAGFIPWDDDADVGMLRADYERFIREAADGLPAGYSLRTFDNTPGYAPMFAKVLKDGTVFETEETEAAGISQPIFVDIFPYDDLSNDREERELQIKKASYWSKLSYLYHAPYVVLPWKGLLRACGLIGCKIAHRYLRFRYSRAQIKEGFEEALHFSADPSGSVKTLAYTDFGEMPLKSIVPVKRMSFEGAMLCCPGDIVSYLTCGFGDNWTELPPVDKRKSHGPIRLDFGKGPVELSASTQKEEIAQD